MSPSLGWIPPSSSLLSGRQARLATVAALLLVFLFDLVVPAGIAAGIPYIAAVIISLWIPDRKWTMATAVVAMLLTVGDVLRPGELALESRGIVLANRALSVLAIGSTAVLGLAARRSLLAARDQSARVQAILENAVEGIITIDDHGRIHSFNSAAERIFGYTAAEVLGQNVSHLMPSPHREAHDAYLARYLATGVKRIIGVGRELLAQRRDGQEFPVEISVSEHWVDGQRMFTGIVRDISERKQIQDRLLQAERLAGIGQMAAGVAHESRNALQRIRARAEMLEMDLEDRPSALADLHAIQRATEDIHNLLEEVRAYAGPIRLERQTTSLRSTWRRAWETLAERRRDRDARLIDAHEDPDPVMCELDAFRMEQVFRNLFDNALAACSDPVEIHVACRPAECGDQPGVCIQITDNGPGFDPEHRDRIFDAFYTTKTKGTGLGLPIVRRIVEAHGGTITAGEPQAGRGAEFRLTLPRCPPASPRCEEPAGPLG